MILPTRSRQLAGVIVEGRSRVLRAVHLTSTEMIDAPLGSRQLAREFNPMNNTLPSNESRLRIVALSSWSMAFRKEQMF